MKYIIIGNGVAGINAALKIREKDEKGEIKILTKEKNHFYSRPRLIDLLGKRVEPEKIIRYDEEFYDEKDIEVLLNTKVTKIKKGSVITEKGDEYKYDKLLLANGSSPFIPDMPGKDLKGVFTIRTIEDVKKVHEYIKDKKKIVIVGGGLLGIEAAYSLSELEKEVTVVEFFDRLLPKQLDKKGANFLQRLLEDKGLNFKLSSEVNEIKGGKKVKSVCLKDDIELECGAVIFSIGVKPNLELVKFLLEDELSLEVNKGIKVDECMKTSQDNIFAAGDVIEYGGVCAGLWKPAQEQGKIAGLNMAGKKEDYENLPLESRLKIVGVPVFSGGKIELNDAKIIRNESKDIYEKYLIKDEKLKGAIVIGDNQKSLLASQVLEGKKELKDLKLEY